MTETFALSCKGFPLAVGVLACVGLSAPMLRAEDWPQFRGANRDGISP